MLVFVGVRHFGVRIGSLMMFDANLCLGVWGCGGRCCQVWLAFKSMRGTTIAGGHPALVGM